MAIGSVFSVIILLLIAFTLLGAFVTVQQGNIAVITFFGKYRRIMMPGLNFKIPYVETIFRIISIQNRSVELQFQAITVDQANVYFKAMLLYSVLNQDENTLKNVAFKFIDEKNGWIIIDALTSTII